MQKFPDSTIIGFSSRFDWKILSHWKHLITKPLHYGIQIGTGSNLHHLGIMYNDWFYEALGKTGVRIIRLEGKLKELDDCVDVITFPPKTILNDNESLRLGIDLNEQLGKKYSAAQAFLSILTKILFLGLRKSKPKNKATFCSKLVFKAYRYLHISKLGDTLPRTINPEECKKILRQKGLIKAGKILKR